MWCHAGLDPDNDESERRAVETLVANLRAAGGTNVDATDNSLRVPPFEFLRIMQAQEFLHGEAGRYWVALSLAEAEALRGAMHTARDTDAPLLPGKRTAVSPASSKWPSCALMKSHEDPNVLSTSPHPT